MSGETNLKTLIQNMSPILNQGDYVFVSASDVSNISRKDTIAEIKEHEGTTLVLGKTKANELNLNYDFVASWITLKIHSALEAVGLTATFSNALAKHNISCNVIAGYYHDHIFVEKKNANKAIKVLKELSRNFS